MICQIGQYSAPRLKDLSVSACYLFLSHTKIAKIMKFVETIVMTGGTIFLTIPTLKNMEYDQPGPSISDHL